MTEANKERDPIRDIARQLGIQTFGDGLLLKIRESIDCLRSQAQACGQYREEMGIVQRQLDKFHSQLHGIPALAEIERLRAALHSCAKASSAAEVCLIVDEALAATTAPEVRQEAVPEETPHIIVFDDADRPNEMFSGAGARPAALRRWQQISVSWNAHLFVRVERNSRDDPYPCARLAAQVSRIPAGLYAELEALRTLRDATGVYLQGYMRDEIEDEDNCVNVDQHDAACSVKSALDNARALEWKGGDK
ncbi:hypothetical protein ACNFCJ_14550 [Pseudomonas sp. NY15364]|uniref:hypothetical protein n=1 Tax=Pseudomonas sp. NY15364 TaxID=3400353 RepID=UPI003A86DFB5